jgi:hypothetical protein
VPVFQEEFIKIIGGMNINGDGPNKVAIAEPLSVEVE